VKDLPIGDWTMLCAEYDIGFLGEILRFGQDDKNKLSR
jgi:hypothetical protein